MSRPKRIDKNEILRNSTSSVTCQKSMEGKPLPLNACLVSKIYLTISLQIYFLIGHLVNILRGNTMKKRERETEKKKQTHTRSQEETV